MDLVSDLAELAHMSSPESFRSEALALVADALDADVGMLVSGGARAERGLSASRAALARGWHHFGAELAPVYAAAMRDRVATDCRTLGAAALERTQLYREVMAPRGGTESLFVLPTFEGRKLGVLMLGRIGRRFSDTEVGVARALASCLSLACAAHARDRELGGADLSAAESDVLRYLTLGYTTRDIARARGTSYFTARNQLSALFRKLGVTNRTEAVGLRLAR